jgi:hypothetical protein
MTTPIKSILTPILLVLTVAVGWGATNYPLTSNR